MSEQSSPETPIGTPSGFHIPWWSWLLGTAAALTIAAAGWILLLAAPMPDPLAVQAIPLFTVYPAPTFTPLPPTETWTPDVSPTAALPTAAPGTIGVGALVEVSSNGAGLTIREAPTTQGKKLFVALDHEVFRILDGPRSSDGYTWWLLVGLIDPNRQGWAVENFLRATTQ